ncbi:nucleotidyltransferase domain-containing protein [candidate division KSB1 bacterium]|nr:nucleotidyltransferase domain-containing protein [candidate division KSB1 bacterium]
MKIILQENDNILFAMLFGSFAGFTVHRQSDIDIALYCRKPFDLIEFGKLIAKLEKAAGKTIDLVELNGLPEKSPLLAYEIATSSQLLFSKNEELVTEFKTKTFIQYIDTCELRHNTRRLFYQKISSNMLGQRNYA